jgi:hypothetical protein
MYQRKYTASLILKKKEDIPQVIYAKTKILKAIDYLNILIFKIRKNFYLDKGNTNGNTIPLTKQIKNIYWSLIKDFSDCYNSHAQDFRPLKLKLLDNGQKFILKARNNILPNFSNIVKYSGNSNRPFCNIENTNVHFIHYQKNGRQPRSNESNLKLLE